MSCWRCECGWKNCDVDECQNPRCNVKSKRLNLGGTNEKLPDTFPGSNCPGSTLRGCNKKNEGGDET